MKEKKYSHDWERIDAEGYSPKELGVEILEDAELPTLEKIVIGQFTPGYDMSVDPLLKYLIENKDKLQHIKSFFFGDMDYTECEVSWIEQGNYEEFLSAFPNITELTIKGSNDLSLGNIEHNNLEKLEIISGGLPKKVIDEIKKGSLPNLKSLILYLGVEEYGFDGDINDIKALIEEGKFPNLIELGLVDSELEDDVVKIVLESKILSQLKILRLGYGALSDKGGQLLLDHADKIKHLDLLDLEYHFLSDEMMKKLSMLPIEKINLNDQQEVDEYEYDGKTYYDMYPMLTE